MSENLIELKNVRKEFVTAKHYPGFKGAVKSLFSKEKIRKTAVDNVSFAIKEGEMVGYIGSNGAGKSTTIKMMSGILTPTSGSCLVNGLEPYKERKKNAKNIGVVFGQRTQLWWDLPLGETYTVLKEIYEVSDQDFAERMAFFQEVLNLQDFMHSTVRTLSLGQRMRADLAAALLHASMAELLYSLKMVRFSLTIKALEMHSPKVMKMNGIISREMATKLTETAFGRTMTNSSS